jgi:hypothetical protein
VTNVPRLESQVDTVRSWLAQQRGLRLKPPARVVSTRKPLVWLGWRIPRGGLTVARKLLRNLRARLLGAAIRGPGPWRRTLAAYRGLIP